MYDKSQFLEQIDEEIRIVRHLATKIPAGTEDWRPGENQRSTIELLRYLAVCAQFPAALMIEEADYKELEASTKDMTLAEFDGAMERQGLEVHRLVEPLTDADMTREITLPWGQTTKIGLGLVSMSLRFLIAYRHALFIYAKSSGATEINTYNNWMGMDPPPPTEG